MPIEVIDHGSVTSESKYTPLTDAEVSQIGLDYFKQLIVASWDLDNPNLITRVFMPLLFLDDIEAKQLNGDGCNYCFEYMHKAGPMAINGYPMFMSCRLLTKADAGRIIQKRTEIAKLLEGV